jgi:hypothetical protein
MRLSGIHCRFERSGEEKISYLYLDSNPVPGGYTNYASPAQWQIKEFTETDGLDTSLAF